MNLCDDGVRREDENASTCVSSSCAVCCRAGVLSIRYAARGYIIGGGGLHIHIYILCTHGLRLNYQKLPTHTATRHSTLPRRTHAASRQRKPDENRTTHDAGSRAPPAAQAQAYIIHPLLESRASPPQPSPWPHDTLRRITQTYYYYTRYHVSAPPRRPPTFLNMQPQAHTQYHIDAHIRHGEKAGSRSRNKNEVASQRRTALTHQYALRARAQPTLCTVHGTVNPRTEVNPASWGRVRADPLFLELLLIAHTAHMASSIIRLE